MSRSKQADWTNKNTANTQQEEEQSLHFVTFKSDEEEGSMRRGAATMLIEGQRIECAAAR